MVQPQVDIFKQVAYQGLLQYRLGHFLEYMRAASPEEFARVICVISKNTTNVGMFVGGNVHVLDGETVAYVFTPTQIFGVTPHVFETILNDFWELPETRREVPLNADVLSIIFGHLGWHDLLACKRVDRAWNNAARAPRLWAPYVDAVQASVTPAMCDWPPDVIFTRCIFWQAEEVKYMDVEYLMKFLLVPGNYLLVKAIWEARASHPVSVNMSLAYNAHNMFMINVNPTAPFKSSIEGIIGTTHMEFKEGKLEYKTPADFMSLHDAILNKLQLT